MIHIQFRHGKEDLVFKVPDNSLIYTSSYKPVDASPETLVLNSIADPIGCSSLKSQLKKRREGKIVIVVSDITRPIPYSLFLPALLRSITGEGVAKNEIQILVATGMHRESTLDEKLVMFGKEVVENYQIIDHHAECEDELATIEGESWSGAEISLNRFYVEAGFRIITGLVEPHFMAGFSGGRKAICPGLASLTTIRKFHGYQFLSYPEASNAVLENNPCHLENTSIARLCPADFSIHIVLDQHKRINRIISGDQFLSHEKAIAYVKERSCKIVETPADLVITSCGGSPLDQTFYQCVKGFVNCLPAIKERGKIIAFGSCSEGIGSPEYEQIMKKYSSSPNDFLRDISGGSFFIKDQWQFQMHIRVLEKIGKENLHFYTGGIPLRELALLSVNPHSPEGNDLVEIIQMQINKAVVSGQKIAVFPEGPYCAAVAR
ncbi:MAG: nickel-dependent lactate racemase [Prolixibacteraceae bacterium]